MTDRGTMLLFQTSFPTAWKLKAHMSNILVLFSLTGFPSTETLTSRLKNASFPFTFSQNSGIFRSGPKSHNFLFCCCWFISSNDLALYLLVYNFSVKSTNVLNKVVNICGMAAGVKQQIWINCTYGVWKWKPEKLQVIMLMCWPPTLNCFLLKYASMPQELNKTMGTKNSFTPIQFYSILGCVLPQQEVALCQSPPTFSVLCCPCPYHSLLPHKVILHHILSFQLILHPLSVTLFL